VYRLGHWKLSNGDAAGAANVLARFTQRFQGSSLSGAARFLEAEAHFRAGDDARALAEFESLATEELAPELAPKVLFRAGLLHCRKERWREGEAELAHLVATFPEFENGPEARLWLARARAVRGDAASARAMLEALVQTDKGRIGAEARLSLGELALSAGDAQSALSSFLKVAVLFSDVELVAAADWGAGRAFEALEQPEQAAGAYRELIAKAPKSPLAARARERIAALAAR
jgi:TolA-binding protein